MTCSVFLTPLNILNKTEKYFVLEQHTKAASSTNGKDAYEKLTYLRQPYNKYEHI